LRNSRTFEKFSQADRVFKNAVGDVAKKNFIAKTKSPADRVFDYAVADVAVEPALHGCIYTCLQ
jgi:hypothetical protein